eukprot:2022820-Pyramimonas_sp.AAC.1
MARPSWPETDCREAPIEMGWQGAVRPAQATTRGATCAPTSRSPPSRPRASRTRSGNRREAR